MRWKENSHGRLVSGCEYIQGYRNRYYNTDRCECVDFSETRVRLLPTLFSEFDSHAAERAEITPTLSVSFVHMRYATASSIVEMYATERAQISPNHARGGSQRCSPNSIHAPSRRWKVVSTLSMPFAQMYNASSVNSATCATER